jgi:hypothetical protein
MPVTKFWNLNKFILNKGTNEAMEQAINITEIPVSQQQKKFLWYTQFVFLLAGCFFFPWPQVNLV